MSSEEVTDIIRTGASYGALIIKFQGLEVHFSPHAASLSSSNYPLAPTPRHPDTNISEAQHAQNNQEALRQNERELRELQISELMITDPLAAEEMIRNGELEDADEQSDGDISVE